MNIYDKESRGKNMKKKGFTLIELLAVIVILAIIALIAVPIILNIIGSSKKSAVVRSGELYLKAMETAISRENLKTQFNPTTCTIENDGNLTCVDKDNVEIKLTIEVNGSKPIGGTIELENGKITKVIQIIIDGYVLEKEQNKNLVLKGTIDILEPSLNPQGTYLNIGAYNHENSVFLGGSISKKTVEAIKIMNTKVVPSNVIGSWDASEAQDGSIMAWYTDKDNNELYELYIGGEGGVKANPNSSNLFSQFLNVTSLDLKYLDTSKVTNMKSMFIGCVNLETIDVSNFDTSKVTNMNSMFAMNIAGYPDSKLNNIVGLDKFNTSSVTNMGSMFNGCRNIVILDLSNFNTSNVIDMHMMFLNCSKLESINLKNATFVNVTQDASMLLSCNRLTTVYVKDEEAKTFIDAKKTGVAVIA